MLEIKLSDRHLSENIKAINELRETGMFSEEQLQELYNKQVEYDESNGASGDVGDMLHNIFMSRECEQE